MMRWFLRGMESVGKAPSAGDKQPVMFRNKDGAVTVAVPEKSGDTEFDLEIAKRHFRLGAGSGAWKWGDGGEFIR